MLLAVPIGSAADPVREPVCDEAIGCVGVGSCVEGTCVPSPCDPSVECASQVGGTRSECVTNVTIDGTTCATSAGVSTGTRRQTSGPGVGDVGRNRVGVLVFTSDGHVFAQNLPNTWTSPGAQVEGTLLSRDLGTTSVALYRSDVTVEGESGRPATPVTSASHQFTHVIVDARTDGGAAGSENVFLDLVLLDLAPETCFFDSTAGSVDDFRCPRLSGLA